MEIAEQIQPQKIGKLFKSDNRYTIPSYQRRYSWGDKQVKELWQDLRNIENKEQDHFFGTVVFMSRSGAEARTTFDIVDGQQRITTVSILFCAIRDHLKENFPEDKVANRIKNIEKSLWLYDLDEQRQGMRLMLGNLDQDSYKHLVNGHLDEVENEKISNAYKLFKQRLETLDDLAKVKILHEKILKQLIYVSITVEEHSDAYLLFEAMNNRGLSLSPIDLMKNYLLMQASKRSDTNDERIEQLWGEVIKNIDSLSGINSPGTTFFRQYFMSSGQHGENEKITTNKLYEPTFIEAIEDTDDIEDLMEDLRNKSVQYRKLLEQEVDQFDRAQNIEINRLLQDVKTVSITPFTLLLRAFSETDDVDLLKRIIQKSNALMLRRQICDRNTGPHDTMFNHLAQRMFDETNPLEYMNKYLKSEDRFPSDEQFEQYFQRESFRKTDRTKYILSKIEEEHFGHGGKEVAQSRYQVHIEHILPERYGDNLRRLWLEPFDISKNEHEEYKKLIGNLMLLESDPNIRASNRTLEKKQQYYMKNKTDFEMAHELVDKSTWDVDAIEQRSERLAKIAVHIWNL